MKNANRNRKRPSLDVLIDAGKTVVPPTPADIERLKALPDGTPDAESPELGPGFFKRAKSGAPWQTRAPGRPAAGVPAPATTVVSLRLPVSLRKAVERRAHRLHVSFNAAMQRAAADWVGTE